MSVFRRRRPGGLGDLPGDLGTRFSGEGSSLATSRDAAAIQPAPPEVPAAARRRVYSFGVRNSITVQGSKLAAPAFKPRRYLKFQNQSLANDMRIEFGVNCSAATGELVPAGTALIWDIICPSDSVSVFCAVAGQPYSITEGVELPG